MSVTASSPGAQLAFEVRDGAFGVAYARVELRVLAFHRAQRLRVVVVRGHDPGREQRVVLRLQRAVVVAVQDVAAPQLQHREARIQPVAFRAARGAPVRGLAAFCAVARDAGDELVCERVEARGVGMGNVAGALRAGFRLDGGAFACEQRDVARTAPHELVDVRNAQRLQHARDRPCRSVLLAERRVRGALEPLRFAQTLRAHPAARERGGRQRDGDRGSDGGPQPRVRDRHAGVGDPCDQRRRQQDAGQRAGPAALVPRHGGRV